VLAGAFLMLSRAWEFCLGGGFFHVECGFLGESMFVVAFGSRADVEGGVLCFLHGVKNEGERTCLITFLVHPVVSYSETRVSK